MLNLLKVSNKKQVVYGVILSYTLIFANAIYGFIIAPFIMLHVGMSDYGVYQTIASLSNTLVVLDIGIGGAVMKFTAEYNAKGCLENVGKLLKASFLLSFGIVIVIVLIGLFILYRFPAYYGDSFTGEEIALGQKMIFLFLLNICLIFIDDLVMGVISGMNRLVISNGIGLLKVLLRYVFILVLVPIIKSTIVIIEINLLLTLAFFAVELYLTRSYLKYIKVKERIDFSYFKEIFKYSSYIIIGGIINQVNSNLDNVIIGAKLGTYYVTIYSFALTLFAAYENLATSISKNLLPTVTKHYFESPNSLQPFVVKIGRAQFLLLGAALFGFLVLGQKFVECWLGTTFKDVYIIGIILLTPATLELCVNTCLTILRAANKLGFRTIILCATTIINLFITIWGVGYFGYVAAAVGTAVSVVLGSLIIMNIYYYKEININIVRVYYGIFKGVLPCLMIASITTYFMDKCLKVSWLSVVVEIFLFLVLYFISLWFWGLNAEEKSICTNTLNKLFKKSNL